MALPSALNTLLQTKLTSTAFRDAMLLAKRFSGPAAVANNIADSSVKGAGGPLSAAVDLAKNCAIAVEQRGPFGMYEACVFLALLVTVDVTYIPPSSGSCTNFRRACS